MKRALPHVGLFLVLAAIYVLSGPGRIDIIDGQYRFDVARSLVDEARPIMRDPRLPLVVEGRDGSHYSEYGVAGSITAVPLVATAKAIDSNDRELAQFLFSFSSAFLAALAGVLLFMTYELLGVARGRAMRWTFATALATLLWPLATSTFDQAQQACVLLAAVYAGLRAARGDSPRWAAAAGLAAAALVWFQQVYIVLVAPLALAAVADGEALRAFLRTRRFVAFAVASAAGVALLVVYNLVRLGTLTAVANKQGLPLLGNPAVGLAGLLVSPGKSVFLYSPPLVLAVLGWRAFRAQHRAAARAALVVIAVQLVLIASLTFWAGDWAWGPRYTVVTLPLACLALPFVTLPRWSKRLVVGLGIAVQLLAISVDHQRFFNERDLTPFFWTSSGLYFRDSALFARPGELRSVLRQDNPDIKWFAPNPYQSATYATFGPPTLRFPEHVWMRRFALFYLPRPWPLWMNVVPADQLPSHWQLFLLLALAALLAGAGATYFGMRSE